MAELLNEAYLAKEKDLFESTWKDVRTFLLSELTMCGPSIDRMEKLLDYTCHGGKMTRAKTITRITEIKLRENDRPPSLMERLFGSGRLRLSDNKDDDPMYAAAILGWCIEMAQAYFLVMDDIVDHSETRRFQPCWYKLPEVGVGLGIVDSVLLRSFVMLTLKRFLGHKPYYHKAVDLFTQCIYMTEVGEMLDTLSEQKRDFQYLTEDTYFNVVWHKTCYYTIHLPVALGLLNSGELEKVPPAELKEITFAVGEYFQIQDDILDCFSDPEHIGKVGTDIQDFKCSWLAVQFMKKATPEQKAAFEANYGKDEEQCIAKIKELYDEVGIKQSFEVLEEEYGKTVAGLLPRLGQKSAVLQQAIEMLWKVTYKRSY